MSSEDTKIGNDWKVQLGDSSSPPNYSDICAAFDFGEVGEEKPLVDVTTYCDNGRTYRNGLADGVEIPLQCNYISGDATTASLYDAYKNDEIVNIRIVSKTEDSPDSAECFVFGATVRAWKVSGPIGGKSVLTFTLKISGAVTWIQ